MTDELNWDDVASELADTHEAPREDDMVEQEPELVAVTPRDRDELYEIVSNCLHARYCDEVQIDDDGDFELDHRGHGLWVRVLENPLRIGLMARVVAQVPDTQAAGLHLAIDGPRYGDCQLGLRPEGVWQYAILPARIFAAVVFDDFFDSYLKNFDVAQADLVLRGMGKAFT
ncbi:T3SS (YopN, CesT) and YbjN peptide-binding chaperone 1 [Rudaeicoccus suwonensis]|uniref:TY-Chap central domain-containing protein n=1 Tax=Rudaeicoccus suwonensis TaxID=657409 RepID=A0A561EC65_9MICO|nr:hypothetical protein [Rudaeicoccus suwonensis]TWE13206.1 hypothetical protein BKA23_2035 [Rudaeicoccus suwonensis]